jgi:hypothetical protein
MRGTEHVTRKGEQQMHPVVGGENPKEIKYLEHNIKMYFKIARGCGLV